MINTVWISNTIRKQLAEESTQSFYVSTHTHYAAFYSITVTDHFSSSFSTWRCGCDESLEVGIPVDPGGDRVDDNKNGEDDVDGNKNGDDDNDDGDTENARSSRNLYLQEQKSRR